MWLRLRNTASRGRAASPLTRSRRRAWRLCRAAERLAVVVIRSVLGLLGGGLLLAADLAGLAGLAADLLAGVADALALVGLGLAGRADARRDLADELLVDADHGEPRRVLDLEADSGGRVDLDRVAVAQVELELPPDERCTIADARDLERLAVARGHADDHVVDQRPGQAVELLVGLGLRRASDEDLVAVARDAHLGMELAREAALGALDRDVPAVDRHIDPGGHGDGQASDSRHRGYQTYARTSPPSWALRACAPVMIPWLVLTMTMPRPPRTRGMAGLAA